MFIVVLNRKPLFDETHMTDLTPVIIVVEGSGKKMTSWC